MTITLGTFGKSDTMVTFAVGTTVMFGTFDMFAGRKFAGYAGFDSSHFGFPNESIPSPGYYAYTHRTFAFAR